MTETSAVTLSVIVATRHPWPEIERCVEALLPQLRACGGELLVGDGDGFGYAGPTEGVRVITKPGASVFELRRDAIAEARGQVIAATEDHCWVDADWCARVLAAHQAHPDASGVAGLVENASRRSLAAWASFLVNFAPFTPPFVRSPGTRIPPPANLSYKAEALKGDLEVGELESSFAAGLDRRGLIAIDDRIRLRHHQPYSAWGALRAHHHNGRASVGLAYAHHTRRDRRRHIPRVVGAGIRIVTETTSHVLRRRSALPLRAIFSLPIVALLAISWTSGAILGLTLGPGSSPEHID